MRVIDYHFKCFILYKFYFLRMSHTLTTFAIQNRSSSPVFPLIFFFLSNLKRHSSFYATVWKVTTFSIQNRLEPLFQFKIVPPHILHILEKIRNDNVHNIIKYLYKNKIGKKLRAVKKENPLYI